MKKFSREKCFFASFLCNVIPLFCLENIAYLILRDFFPPKKQTRHKLLYSIKH